MRCGHAWCARRYLGRLAQVTQPARRAGWLGACASIRRRSPPRARAGAAQRPNPTAKRAKGHAPFADAARPCAPVRAGQAGGQVTAPLLICRLVELGVHRRHPRPSTRVRISSAPLCSERGRALSGERTASVLDDGGAAGTIRGALAGRPDRRGGGAARPFLPGGAARQLPARQWYAGLCLPAPTPPERVPLRSFCQAPPPPCLAAAPRHGHGPAEQGERRASPRPTSG